MSHDPGLVADTARAHDGRHWAARVLLGTRDVCGDAPRPSERISVSFARCVRPAVGG